MSWMQKLHETYENAVLTQAVADSANPLPEMGFILGEMPLTVTLSSDGQFVDAIRTKEEEEILIPCTLLSGVARQNPVRPHPLFDELKNLGTPEQMALLKSWSEGPETPQSVRAVRAYLERGTLRDDVEQALKPKGAMPKDKDGVRFRVINTSLADPQELWKSAAVRESWKVYFRGHCLSENGEELCYVLGEKMPAIVKHPYAMGTMYLISMTDERCRGRFSGHAQEALSVSAEASLKAHAALKWLIKRQGGWLGKSSVVVAWDTGGGELPNIVTYDPADPAEGDYEEGRPPVDTWFQLGKAVADGSRGYESRLLRELGAKAREEFPSSVVVMALDSASGKGRAAVVYYQELDLPCYLQNLQHWYSSCRWKILRSRDGKASERFRTPLPREIANLIYGSQDSESSRKLKGQLMKRLIPCITNQQPIPRDIVLAAFRKAVNPMAFQRNGKWEGYLWAQAVGVACALVRKQYEEEEHPMALDENNTNRDYLYGRLLAVADVAEYKAMSSLDTKERQTNAVRYMQRFQQRPAETWTNLRSHYLPPYLARLKGNGVFYTKLMDEITAKFQQNAMGDPDPLDVRFLEGYSCQKQKLFEKKDRNGKNDATDEEEEE